MCPKGHKHSIKWGDWQQGHKCPTCAKKTKPILKQVEESFNAEEFILLSKEYTNANTKLNYRCSKGHEHSIRWSSWQRGQRCPTCAGNIKLTIEQIRESFEIGGYILLSKEYIGNNNKLHYICFKGHEHYMSWNSWQQGKRCPSCDKINLSLRQIGDRNHQWKGGISFEPDCPIWKDKEYKQDIRERDGNRCLNPYCNSKKSNDLTVHHIDYDKKNCKPDNLITICRSCNCMANKDRDWHQTWYKAIIKNRYCYRSV
jgi:hypothetical protein